MAQRRADKAAGIDPLAEVKAETTNPAFDAINRD